MRDVAGIRGSGFGIRESVIFVIAVISVFLAACSPPPDALPGVLVIAMQSYPNNLDPRIGTDEASQKLHQLLYDPLLRIDDSLRIVPGLASSWENPDPLTYIVRLRPNVRFHDGRVLSAADVVFTFGSFLDPAFVSARKGAYRLLDSVRAIDPLTVEFKLKEPFGSFPINLVMQIVPAPGTAGPREDFARHPVGTGPYSLVRAATDDRVVLAAFPDYFNGTPKNPGLVVRTIPDDTMRGLELRKGSVHLIVNDLSPDIAHQLARDEGLQLVEAPGTDYAYVGLNLRDPVLRDARVRQALTMAIDRKGIVEYLRRGQAQVASGILPRNSWAFAPDATDFPFDPDRAGQLLDQAGFPDPDGDGPRPRFTLSLKVSSSEFYRLQAAVIQQDLQRVGVHVDIRSYEFATLYADVLSGNFQMYTLVWVGVSDPDMLRRVYHSRQMPPSGFNRGFFNDARVDRAIDAATTSADDVVRAQYYRDAQRLIAQEAPVISLWQKNNIAVGQRALTGIHLSPLSDFGFLKDVH